MRSMVVWDGVGSVELDVWSCFLKYREKYSDAFSSAARDNKNGFVKPGLSFAAPESEPSL